MLKYKNFNDFWKRDEEVNKAISNKEKALLAWNAGINGLDKLDKEIKDIYDGYASRLIRAAKDVFNWYYIFGEDSDAAKEHLAELGNAIKNYESHKSNSGIRQGD